MKKIYVTLFAVITSLGLAFGQSPACVIDQNNTEFLTPPSDSFPCIERNIAYSEAIQLHIPASFSIGVTVTVDSFVITGITGLPAGITYACNPADCVFPGGSNGCINFSGTTAVPPATFPLTFQGRAYGNAPGLGAQNLDINNPLIPAQYRPTYNVYVINAGDSCRGPVGINKFNADLNSSLSVFPNPSNGVFEVKLNAGSRVNGEIAVMDVTGKKVFVQPLDVTGMYNTTINLSAFAKGIYTVQLRTAEGFASKNISIE